MKKSVKERYILAYDAFREYIERGEWLNVPRDHPAAKRALQQAKQTIESTAIRLFSNELCTVLTELTHKAGATPVPFASLPVLPLWVEFESFLGTAEIAEEALALDPDSDKDRDAPVAALWIVQEQERIVVELITPRFYSKVLCIYEKSWSYMQRRSACTSQCPHAELAVNVAITSDVAPDLAKIGCLCAQSALLWSQLVALVAQLLHSPRPIVVAEICRDLPLPRDTFRRGRMDAENRRYPRYKRYSLSEPVIIDVTAPAPKSERQAQSGRESSLETRQVAGHWRFLIPGEGKPWKTMKTIFVEKYQRHQRIAKNPTRHIIDP